MGFPRQEFWTGSPCPAPGIFLTMGLNSSLLRLLHWQVGSSPLAPPGKPLMLITWKPSSQRRTFMYNLS